MVALVTIARFIGLTLWVERAGEAAGIAVAKAWIVGRLPGLVVS